MILKRLAVCWRKQRGSQFDYSEQAILVVLTVGEVFHLTNRGAEGFVRSIFQLMRINLPVPDHSTLSKRGQDLKVNLPKRDAKDVDINHFTFLPGCLQGEIFL